PPRADRRAVRHGDGPLPPRLRDGRAPRGGAAAEPAAAGRAGGAPAAPAGPPRGRRRPGPPLGLAGRGPPPVAGVVAAEPVELEQVVPVPLGQRRRREVRAHESRDRDAVDDAVRERARDRRGLAGAERGEPRPREGGVEQARDVRRGLSVADEQQAHGSPGSRGRLLPPYEPGPRHTRARRAPWQAGSMSRRELVVLGTASMVPTRTRNHNGYVLLWDDEA